MDLEDGLATREVGKLHGDAAIEAAGAKQGRVERLWAVGGGEHHDALVVVEAVHLGEELVQRLLALVVGVDRHVALLAHGIDLVDEDDAGGLLVGLLEEVAHLGGATTHEHLHELRARDLEERHARLAGDGLGHEGLTGAGRAHEQRSARAAGADLVVFLGLLEEAHDLLERLLGLVLTGDVLERDAGLLALDLLGAGLAKATAHAKARAEAHGGAVVAHGLLHAAVEPPADAHEDDDGQPVRQQEVEPESRALVLLLRGEVDVMLLEAVHQRIVVGEVCRAVGDVGLVLERVRDLVAAGVEDQLLHLVLVDLVEHLVVRDVLHGGALHVGIHHRVERHDGRDRDDHVQDHRLSLLLVVHSRSSSRFRRFLPATSCLRAYPTQPSYVRHRQASQGAQES